MRVEWTAQAEKDFEKYVNFLAKNISYKASADFMEATFDTIEKIRNPLVNYQIVDSTKGSVDVRLINLLICITKL